MSEITPEDPADATGVVDPEKAALRAQVYELQTELAAAQAPAKRVSAFKAKLAKIGNGILAAVTSDGAVREEKSIAALVIARLLLFAGSSAGVVTVVDALLKAFGVTN